ncbi:unnamed protein product [Rhizophagus irregularis]|nr:unnamed protein product [Rhizophagus irregularis]
MIICIMRHNYSIKTCYQVTYGRIFSKHQVIREIIGYISLIVYVYVWDVEPYESCNTEIVIDSSFRQILIRSFHLKL